MNSYLLFKSLHLIAVISWMAGLLYLPRIFVYHAENNNEIISNVFRTMERKLFYYIMTPAMALSWIFGLVLIYEIGFQQLSNLWLQLKLILVVLLTTYHIFSQNKRDKLKETHWFLMQTNYQGALTPQIEEGITIAEFKDQSDTQTALKNSYANIHLVFEAYQN